MLGMYALNAKSRDWWQAVNVIIWDASAKLVTGDPEVQALAERMLAAGLTVEACKACSHSFWDSKNYRSWG